MLIGEYEVGKNILVNILINLIIDDLLATGGTVEATAKMIEELGGEVVGCAFLIELEGLGGREKLNKYDVFTLMKYEGRPERSFGF